MEEVLSLQGLCKRYPSFELKDVSFFVRKGEIMGFIGRNGAGKTTTLKSLLNFVHPDSGAVQFFGADFLAHEDEIKARIGFVAGGVDYYMQKPLKTIASVTKTFYSTWDDAAWQRYTQMFSLDENKKCKELSAGMKVKFNLAMALSHHAELLILDEPTSGLDPVSRDDLLEVFLRLAQEGVSILFSTHITSDLDKCADRITYIRSGRIVVSETLGEFTEKYRVTELTKEQLTDSVTPLLIGKKLSKHGYTALVRADAAFPYPTQKADLETVMVHLEKEGETA